MVTFATTRGWKPSPEMLLREQEEFDKGERKRSNLYTCHCCGMTTRAKVMSDRRKLYLCADCFKGRCDFCEGPTLSTVRVGSRSIQTCKNCEAHPYTFGVVLALLRISKKQKYLDFIKSRDERRQRILDALNNAIQEVQT